MSFFVMLTLVLLLASVFLYQGRLKPERLVFVRNHPSLSNPKIWYPTCGYVASLLKNAGVALAGIAIFLSFASSLSVLTYVLLNLLAWGLALIVIVVRTRKYLKKLDISLNS